MSLKEVPNSKELGSEGSASETTSISAITYTAEEERAVVRKSASFDGLAEIEC